MTGLLYSAILLFGVLLIGFLMQKAGVSETLVRKFVHMGVGNWWFIEMNCFTTLSLALVGPISFIVLNSLFVFIHQGESEQKRNYGLIYYPISLLVLVMLQYGGALSSKACLCGVLTMAYGDSLAALSGKKWGKKKLPLYMYEKTWVGFFVMFVVSFIVGLLVCRSVIGALLVALVAALSEAMTPLGLDNISVPILVAFVAGAFV